MTTLTIGKLHGMQQIADPDGLIRVTAIDHRGSLKKMLEKASPGKAIGFAEVVAEKLRMVHAFAPHSTAILLDPVYGAAQAVAGAALPRGCGLLVALEDSGYQGGSEGRLTPITPGWSVSKIKRMGAAAVKLLLYYHPFAEVARKQEELVQRVAEECRRHDIAFLLEPLSYPIRPGQQKESAAFAREKPEIVIESARRLSGLGIDLLKAEFPDDPHFETDESRMRANCKALTASSPVPWVILSAGETFSLFERMVQIACQEGASGFMVGRAIWQEGMALPEAAQRDRFLATTATSRLRKLSAIATAYARPWTWRFDLRSAVEEGWQASYAEALS